MHACNAQLSHPRILSCSCCLGCHNFFCSSRCMKKFSAMWFIQNTCMALAAHGPAEVHEINRDGDQPQLVTHSNVPCTTPVRTFEHLLPPETMFICSHIRSGFLHLLLSRHHSRRQAMFTGTHVSP